MKLSWKDARVREIGIWDEVQNLSAKRARNGTILGMDFIVVGWTAATPLRSSMSEQKG